MVRRASGRVARTGMGVLLAAAVIAMASCASDRRDTSLVAVDASTQPAHETSALLESAGARSRVAELRARFPRLGRGVASSFERMVDGRVRGVIPADAKRGVTKTGSVAFPASARDAVGLDDDTSHLALTFTLHAASDTPIEVADGIAMYRGALRGADVVHRVHAEGTEDFVVFESKPEKEELAYDVDVSHVAGLRLVGDLLEFLDASGAPRLRIAPPYVLDAMGARYAATLAVAGCAYDRSPAAPWGRAVVSAGSPTCGVRVAWGGGGVAYPALVDPNWTATGSMADAREHHTAAVLASGRVLVAGGENPAVLSTAELFDPTGGTFAATGSMGVRRYDQTASVLASGKVLVAGGSSNTGPVSSAELYDPTAGTFVATGTMTAARQASTASVLASGKVLVAGGFDGTYLTSAELYDPTAGTFAATAAMLNGRYFHTASVLVSGKVLVAGGSNLGVALSSAELYDPTAATFGTIGAMTAPRSAHTASVLGTGKVLVTGGGAAAPYSSSAELYDPTAGTFRATGSMAAGRGYHTASVLASGKVLVTGSEGPYLSSAELYDPAAGTFGATGAMTVSRGHHSASVLASGSVLIAGGASGTGEQSTAEIFLQVAAGGTCSVSTDCASLVCDDGICCSGPCNGSCQTCTVGTGACVSVINAPDPDTCTGAKACDASGSCKDINGQACSNVGTCQSAFCVMGRCCDSACTGACQTCGTPPVGTCKVASAGSQGNSACPNGFACDGLGTTCPTSCTSDDGCLPSHYCAADGTCQLPKPQGAACNSATNADCRVAGCRVCNCYDGVCCDTPCTEQCRACDVAGHVGTCSVVSGAPHGSRAACAGGPPCGATCDGTNPTTCQLPMGPSGSCTSTCATDKETTRNCDGMGGCRVEPASVCNNSFGCNANGTACNTTCTKDADCALSYGCSSNGTCVPTNGAKCSDKHTSQGADGTAMDCTPYICGTDGKCASMCTSVNECTSPNVCDPSSKCVAPPNQANGSSGGCSLVRTTRADGPVHAGWLAAVGVLVAVRRRRRRA